MNKTGMSSAEWHKFNGHLKSFIMKGRVSIEHIGDSRVVCFDVSSRCRGNTNYNLSDFEPQEIPATKMKIDIIHTSLYQKYLEWYGKNGEKLLTSKVAGKRFSEIGIKSKQVQTGGGKREWQYILNRSKIVAKLCESSLGDIEEFSDIPQPDLPKNKITDIRIFNVPENISLKIILPQPERQADRKNTPLPNISKNKKADKQDDLTQTLFDYS
ncbi:hypothetical protein RhiirA1_479906 [Rhizophagus irregularis]|uniref:Uncharacterized protein n=1 Tax=Rhizophagus irregularis TaxID=588596 RepID=A0A2N0QQ20_9GLOM|nr:hypothetical protein RhiirA1_479906 [Rhizophagus irregularis]